MQYNTLQQLRELQFQYYDRDYDYYKEFQSC